MCALASPKRTLDTDFSAHIEQKNTSPSSYNGLQSIGEACWNIAIIFGQLIVGCRPHRPIWARHTLGGKLNISGNNACNDPEVLSNHLGQSRKGRLSCADTIFRKDVRGRIGIAVGRRLASSFSYDLGLITCSDARISKSGIEMSTQSDVCSRLSIVFRLRDIAYADHICIMDIAQESQ